METKYLFEVLSKVTNYKYKVYKVKRKRNGKIYYKIYNYFTDTFEWWFSDRFVLLYNYKKENKYE